MIYKVVIPCVCFVADFNEYRFCHTCFKPVYTDRSNYHEGSASVFADVTLSETLNYCSFFTSETIYLSLNHIENKYYKSSGGNLSIGVTHSISVITINGINIEVVVVKCKLSKSAKLIFGLGVMIR